MRRNLLVVSVYSSEASYLTLLRYHLPYRRNEVVAKVIFLHLSVIHSVHRRGLPQCMLGYCPPPPGADPPEQTPLEQTPQEQTPLEKIPPEQTPLEQTPQSRPPQEQTPPQSRPLRADPPPRSRHPPGETSPRGDPPGSRHPPGADTLLGADPPGSRHPPQEADSSIRSTCGRYASYWNAFLFLI